ncbi:MAG: hypothetical protein IPP76_05490 [Moraxellaceae bacterium]|nr:hypothetical protein [Moraxellaceae bacterium]
MGAGVFLGLGGLFGVGFLAIFSGGAGNGSFFVWGCFLVIFQKKSFYKKKVFVKKIWPKKRGNFIKKESKGAI